MPKVILSSGASFIQVQGASILESGKSANVPLPYSCGTGRCSTCRCRVIQGETVSLNSESGLSELEKAQGWILSCVRSAINDVTLEVEDLGGVVLPTCKTLPCRISTIDRLTEDVLRVVLRLPPKVDFVALPGQYIDIIGPSGVRRSYSLANDTTHVKNLELHIRAVKDGQMSNYWFNHAKPNDLLRINGPLGTFFLREIVGVNLVFLATGTGIAPVKAILESLASVAPELSPKSITVFWGGRRDTDLYFDIKSITAGQRFVPVISGADASWTGFKGYVQNALLDIVSGFENTVVYACGSDLMVRSAKTALMAAGLPAMHFHADAFVPSGSL